jgi:hypothetical protein
LLKTSKGIQLVNGLEFFQGKLEDIETIFQKVVEEVVRKEKEAKRLKWKSFLGKWRRLNLARMMEEDEDDE